MPADSINISDIDREKLELERDKVRLEKEKLELERQKTRWTTLSIMVPLLAVTITTAVGFWSQYKQSRDQIGMKLIEAIVDGDSDGIKASLYLNFYSDYFPPKYVKEITQEINEGLYKQRLIRGAYTISPRLDQVSEQESAQRKKEIFDLLASKCKTKEELIELRKKLFPEDTWIDSLK